MQSAVYLQVLNTARVDGPSSSARASSCSVDRAVACPFRCDFTITFIGYFELRALAMICQSAKAPTTPKEQTCTYEFDVHSTASLACPMEYIYATPLAR